MLERLGDRALGLAQGALARVGALRERSSDRFDHESVGLAREGEAAPLAGLADHPARCALPGFLGTDFASQRMPAQSAAANVGADIAGFDGEYQTEDDAVTDPDRRPTVAERRRQLEARLAGCDAELARVGG